METHKTAQGETGRSVFCPLIYEAERKSYDLQFLHNSHEKPGSAADCFPEKGRPAYKGQIGSPAFKQVSSAADRNMKSHFNGINVFF